MKIGILTFHRAHNYGAVLQCYALQETLKSMGHDVNVINYIQKTIDETYHDHRSFSLRTFAKKLPIASWGYALKSLYIDINTVINGSQRKRVFEQFVHNRLNITPECSQNNIPQDFDVYIVGSDMVWDDVCTGGCFDDVFLGNFAHNTSAKLLGYAVSGTARSFERLGKDFNYKHLTNFYNVSIRERSFADIVKKFTGKDYPVCLDPTLLANSKIWEPLLNSKWETRNYIVTYYIRVSGVDKAVINEKVRNYANEQGYEIVNLDATAEAIPVEEFLSIIRYSKYMVTDSFHGIIFSLLFHRSFNALIFHDSGDSRYVNLLTSIGLQKACVEKDFTPAIWAINYSEIDEKLQILRKPSREYLYTNI